MSEDFESAIAPQNDSNVVTLPRLPKREQDVTEFLDNCNRIREGLMSIADIGSGIDSGGGSAGRDFWVKVNGSEYLVHVTVSNAK